MEMLLLELLNSHFDVVEQSNKVTRSPGAKFCTLFMEIEDHLAPTPIT